MVKVQGRLIVAAWVTGVAAAAWGQQIKFNQIAIHDPAVNNVVGATLLVPDGWQVEGGFAWMPHFSMQCNLLLRITDPRSGAAVTWLPSQQFNWPMKQGFNGQPHSNWLGSYMLPPPRDALQFVQAFYVGGPLQHLHQHQARLLGTQDLPQVAAEARRAIPPNLHLTVTRMRFAYQVNGQAWEEDLYITLTYAPPTEYTSMWWGSGLSLRAPAGQLDAATPVLMVPVLSTRLTLEWSAMLEVCKNLHRAGRQQEIEDTRRLGELARQYREQAVAQHQQVWQERMASQDRQNFAFRETLGGIETFNNPFEYRHIELPAGYRDYWVNSQGQYILSMDQSFNPNHGQTQDWRKMQRHHGP